VGEAYFVTCWAGGLWVGKSEKAGLDFPMTWLGSLKAKTKWEVSQRQRVDRCGSQQNVVLVPRGYTGRLPARLQSHSGFTPREILVWE
jgi:hypothetical protein